MSCVPNVTHCPWSIKGQGHHPSRRGDTELSSPSQEAHILILSHTKAIQEKWAYGIMLHWPEAL
jgi:hypothetical protein